MTQTNVKWQVSLSNGETFQEGNNPYEVRPGELSPWQRLIKYIAVNKLQITSIGLVNIFGQTFNLPSAGRNPKFRVFAQAEQPLDFNFFRQIGADMTVPAEMMKKGGELNIRPEQASDWFTVIEAIYSKHSLQIWVDENNPKNSWVLVKE